MDINWEEIDKQAKTQASTPQYKTYAPNGEYTVTLAGVEIVDREGWKSPAMHFIWADDDEHRYPRSVSHWLSIGNPSYRAQHNREILMHLGIEKAKAQELIQVAERDQDRAKLVKAYEALYKRVAERKPKTTIVVQDQYRDGKPVIATSSRGTQYTPNESDFKEFKCRVMERHETSPLAGAEAADDILPSEIPF